MVTAAWAAASGLAAEDEQLVSDELVAAVLEPAVLVEAVLDPAAELAPVEPPAAFEELLHAAVTASAAAAVIAIATRFQRTVRRRAGLLPFNSLIID